MATREKRPIYGNPWVYLEASYQADRTYTSLVRAFQKRYPEAPYLPQLAGMFPINYHYRTKSTGPNAVNCLQGIVEVCGGFAGANS